MPMELLTSVCALSLMFVVAAYWLSRDDGLT